jgi:hypothetical protein
MNVGYFSISHNSPKSFINLDLLEKQEIVRTTGYIHHVRFDSPLTVMMDGRSRQAIIRFENGNGDLNANGNGFVPHTDSAKSK